MTTRNVTATCGRCGEAFQRWRGDAQRNKTDSELRCRACLAKAASDMSAVTRVLTIQVALDAEIDELDTCIASPTIVDIREALMQYAPFSDHVIGVSLMAETTRSMNAEEFDVAISTEGKAYHA